jgi:NAD(P)-dependent dehydrogenase (short-subunit alcohol dehydrogenase family)
MDCTRKHTLVTGCSSGIGRATALRLAAVGQHVYAGVRNLGDGVQLARAAAGGELTPVMLDVTEASHIAAATAAIAEHTTAAGRDGRPGLDGLVNNAGFGLACPAELVQLDVFRRQLEVNVTGQLAVTQAFLPSLRAARGRIVMVSTIGVRFTPPFAGPLDATKAALAALGDALRQELAPWGVRVVVIEPASINSGAADKVSRDAAAAMAAAGPQGRALYEDTFGKMLGVMQRREESGSPPDVAAATIARALTATRPRSMYLTGKNSRRLAILSKLPTPMIDAARRRIFQLPAPGSLAAAPAQPVLEVTRK